MIEPSTTDPAFIDSQISRRGILRVGGLTVALGALVAACANEVADKKPARIGDAPTPSTLPEAVVSDAVIFRTAVSMHYSFIDAHKLSKQLGKLTADQSAIIDAYITANQEAIKELQTWTAKAGGEEWTCANPRFDRVILGPIKARFTGRPKQGAEETDVPPTDDPNRDAMALSHGIETLAAATHQSLVPQLSQPEYRGAVMTQGHKSARRAAALALFINPDNLLSPGNVQTANIEATTTTAAAATTTTQNIAQSSGGATTTTVPTIANPTEYYAIPSQFGILSAVQQPVGIPSSGAQFSINMETPSLNSFIYAGQTCSAT